jgi:putative membrane protein
LVLLWNGERDCSSGGGFSKNQATIGARFPCDELLGSLPQLQQTARLQSSYRPHVKHSIVAIVTLGQTSTGQFDPAKPVASSTEVVYVALFATAFLLWWLCAAHPEVLPFWAPWDFSWLEFLSAWLAVYWYIRGVLALAPQQRPSPPRRVAFGAGVLVIYVVLETHFEYLAEHQFFFNRIQHVAMHHAGPLLIALAWPGSALWEGMPAPMRRLVGHPSAIRLVRVLQQPLLAAILFSGSFFFWLIPAVHFRAMIDPNIYSAMNWTMIADGILFWCLVLDPRPAPPALASFGARAALAVAVMFPQVVGGAMITFTRRDLYSFYNLCGRIYPQLGAHVDQAVGGLIIWIPPAMMSVLALLLVLNNLRRVEEAAADIGVDDDQIHRPIISASQWTGL